MGFRLPLHRPCLKPLLTSLTEKGKWKKHYSSLPGSPWRDETSTDSFNPLFRFPPILTTSSTKPNLPEPISLDDMEWHLFSKSHIKRILRERAPHLNGSQYLAAAEVFPFRNNPYVLNKLIDWSNVPNDPIFRLTFPQPDMLKREQLDDVLSAMRVTELVAGATERSKRNYIVQQVEKIRAGLNPHPAGQKEENVPKFHGFDVDGCQHKYRETVLFFPHEGQFCHTYCSYCFRWAQFTAVGSKQQFKSHNEDALQRYIAGHPNVRDVLFTGGDPLVMTTKMIRRYVEPLISNPATSHLNTIRFGTKSLAYWPYRFTTDPEAKSTLSFFEKIKRSGKAVSIQAHFSHPRELETPEVQEAMRLIQMTGAVIRTQAPLIRGINDSAEVWTKMWNLQTRLGAFPYYMFIERDTGAHDYFSVPLARAFDIFTNAKSHLAGTARKADGPSMSAGPGKISIAGITEIPGHGKVFVLKFLQSRNPEWTKKTFFAEFDEEAVWLDDLKPAFGEREFFFHEEYERIRQSEVGSSGQMDFGVAKCGGGH